jgi:hypothetical protein
MKVKYLLNKEKDRGYLQTGGIYTVYAILKSCNGLQFLLSEDDDSPMSHSVNDFEILNNALPPIWYFTFQGNYPENGRPDLYTEIWGYKEIVYDKNHWYNLVAEPSRETRDIFTKRKKELDEYEDPGIKKPISENSYY